MADYQQMLFAVDSLPHLADVLHGLPDDFDEDTRDRHGLPPLTARGFMTRPGPTASKG